MPHNPRLQKAKARVSADVRTGRDASESRRDMVAMQLEVVIDEYLPRTPIPLTEEQIEHLVGKIRAGGEKAD